MDLHGDPGERVADAMEWRDVDGDGRTEIVVGQHREGVSACGQPLQLLYARALDVRGALRPVEAAVSHESPLTLAGSAGSDRPAPLVRGLRWSASSSQRGTPEDAASLGPPTGMSDGDASTGWSEGRGAGGRGETVRAFWSGPPVVGLDLRTTGAITMPSRFVLRLDDHAYLVTIPEAAREHAWVALPEPVRASCLSITLDDDQPRAPDAQLGFGEVGVYSLADGPDGVASLVELLVAESSDADRAVEWLASVGEDVLPTLQGSWERLSARGHRRALRVASGLERRASEPGRAMVRELRARAALDDDAEVREDAIRPLANGTDEDRLTLFEIARREPVDAPIAAAALAHGRGIPESVWGSLSSLEHEIGRASCRERVS
jgi:hypothetical protein